MSMMTLKCPKCGAEAKLSLADNDYSGPRRCWKCHEFFTITIHNNQVTSCEPLSKEDYERQQEAKKAADKMGISYRPEPQKPSAGGGINFSKQAQMDFAQDSQVGKDSGEEPTDIFKVLAGKSKGGIDFSKPAQPETPPKQEFIRAPMPKEPAAQKKAETPAPVSPPVKRQEFVRPPMPKEPSGPVTPLKPGATFPPDRFQTFIPVEDIKEEPKKPKKKDTPPPERFNSGIPPQT